MKFDTVIIGGGLSGLVCGIRLMQQGRSCVIISSGQSALHFSSGSFDLLNTLPNGNTVTNPLEAVNELIKLSPKHPYAKLGGDGFGKLAHQAQSFLGDIGIKTHGNALKNHYRITPLGIMKPTWLTFSDFAVSDSDKSLPWKKVAIFTLTGFLDFYPHFIADAFKQMGTDSKIHLFNLPKLKSLFRNMRELRSTNIARVLDKNEDKEEFVKILVEGSKDCEAIILPAFLRLDNQDIISELSQAAGKPVYMIPTLPPSIAGIQMQQYLHHCFLKSGGVYMLGDNIRKAETENNKVVRLYSFNHGDIPFTGDHVVLATGSYFSQGLIAVQNKVYEPVFALDVAYHPDRQQWYDADIFHPQNYQQFGVCTDESFRGLKNGQPIDNLYVSGAILNGFDPIKEGSGAGVSILSALHIADEILSK